MSDRLMRGLPAVLLIAAGLWLVVRAVRAPQAPEPAIAAVPVQASAPLDSLRAKPEEGERGASSIPPIKLIREKKSVRRSDTSVPPPSK